MLTIIPPSLQDEKHDDSFNFIRTSFVWAQVRVSCDGPPSEVHVPGRCHSASLVGKDKLVIFGGSAQSTNAVVVMDVSGLAAGGHGEQMGTSGVSSEEDTKLVSMYAPTIFGRAPSERLSALCAQVGKYFLVQGGYEKERGCLSDCLVSDLPSHVIATFGIWGDTPVMGFKTYDQLTVFFYCFVFCL